MSKPTADTKWAASATKTEPSSGQKDAGFTVGTKPFAQWENWWKDAVDQWVKWLSAFESTAHTWSAQQTFTAGAGVNPLTSDGTVGGGNVTGIIGKGSGTGSGVSGANLTGTGYGVFGLGGTGGGAGGILGQAGPGTTDPGVVGFGNGGSGGGPGVAGYGNSSTSTPAAGGDGVLGVASTDANAAGVRGRASAGTQLGVRGEAGANASSHGVGGVGPTGGVAGAGVVGFSGGTSNTAAVYGLSLHAGVPGVLGVGSPSGSAAGVVGNTNATTNVAAVSGVSSHAGVPGVRGQTQGSTGEAAVEGNASANDGYGVMAVGKINTPARAALRVVPQNNAPSSPQQGDIYVTSVGVLMIYAAGSWVKVSSQ